MQTKFQEISEDASAEDISDLIVQWEWDSNENPWLHEEPLWAPYNKEHNDSLEEAYKQKQQVVDIGDYIVSLKDRLQICKKGVFKQRAVRRVCKITNTDEDFLIDDEESIRKERFFGAETPKTYNNAFGSLEDILSFFKGREPKIRDFVNLFEEIQESIDVEGLKQKILPHLVECVQGKAAKVTEQLKTKIVEFSLDDANQSEKIQEQIEDTRQNEKALLNLFQRPFASFKEFYQNIIQAYTMDTFLYRYMNEYLRNENWMELDCLLPYAFCLGKAFLCEDLVSSNNESLSENNSIILFRGAAFDENSLSFYDPKATKTFSWYGVTSTSTNRKIAQNFMLRRSKSTKKIPVMFIIEVSMDEKTFKDTRLINAKVFSSFPNEDEMVLPSGSIFELTQVTCLNKITEIHLKLVQDTNTLIHQGQIMHGALQAATSSDIASKIVCLEGEDLLKSLEHRKGNKLINDIEFSMCKLDMNILSKLSEIFKTMKNLRSLSFISIFFEDQADYDALTKELVKVNLQELIIKTNLIADNQFFAFAKEIQNFKCLITLNLDFSSQYSKISNHGVRDLCQEGLQHLDLLETLVLNFSHCGRISDEGVEDLSIYGLQQLKSLRTLNLNLSDCGRISDKGMKILSVQGLQQLISLTTLILNVSESSITNEGLQILSSSGIQYLHQLESLNLDLSGNKSVTDVQLLGLCFEGSKNVESLKNLSLCFSRCIYITASEIQSFFVKVIQKTISLTSLNLDFSDCSDGTYGQYEDIKDLYLPEEGLHHLKSLINLSLNLCTRSSQITKDGMSLFCSGSMQQLRSLTTLNLNLCSRFCQSNVTDDDIYTLCCQGLQHLKLTTLGLDFSSAYPITDTGLFILATEGLQPLKSSLISLKLNFSELDQISDYGIENLGSQGIKHLRMLNNMELDLTSCTQISDSGIQNLYFGGIQQLQLLKTLDLTVLDCPKVSKEFLQQLIVQVDGWNISQNINNTISKDCVFRRQTNVNMDSEENNVFLLQSKDKSNALKLTLISELTDSLQKNKKRLDFKNLEFLCLDLSENFEINKEKLEDLCLIEFSIFQKLITLDINCSECSTITNEVLLTISHALIQNSKSLVHLKLNLSNCKLISDEGLFALCSEGIQHLNSLITLKLVFYGCSKITDIGIKLLFSEGIQHLQLLANLDLDFSSQFSSITDEGIEFCSKELKRLKMLNSLGLNFSSQFTEISENGLMILSSEGLYNFHSLTDLSINFAYCDKISNEAIKHFGSQGLRHLKSLRRLTLDFSVCQKITDVGIGDLCFEGIQHLKALNYLDLSFSESQEISDNGIKNLCVRGIHYLKSLVTLKLNFSECPEITGEGLKILCFEGIRHLRFLTILHFNFSGCEEIKDEDFEYLKQILKYFGHKVYNIQKPKFYSTYNMTCNNDYMDI